MTFRFFSVNLPTYFYKEPEKFGVWVDLLCAPPKPEQSSEDLSFKDVSLLLGEGLAQSTVVIGLATLNYQKPSKKRPEIDSRMNVGKRPNWTRKEYLGDIGKMHRVTPLLRFLLHDSKKTKINPKPDREMRWSEDLNKSIVPGISRLIRLCRSREG